MKKNSLTSIVLELNNATEKSQSQLKIPISKLNIRETRSNLQTARDSPSKQSKTKIIYSARGTPNQSLADIMRETHRLDQKVETYKNNGPQRSSSVPRKTLPKLYTENLQRKVSEKYNNLKDKYGVLYKRMLKAHGINVEKEDFRQIMKKSKPIFDKTYSVKYYGAMNSEFGIISQRVPFQPTVQELYDPKSSYNFTSGQVVAHEISTAHQSKTREFSNVGSTSNNLEQFASVAKEDNSNTPNIIQTLNEAKELANQSDYSKTPPDSTQKNKKVVIYSLGDDMKFQLVAANPNKPIRSITDLDEKRTAHFDSMVLSEKPKRQTSEVNLKKRETYKESGLEMQPEVRVITNYALPKKMEAIKKRRHTNKEEPSKEIQPYSNQVTSEIEQKEFLVRKSRTNKGMVLGLTSREYMDELSIPERFRTHEIKALLSARTNYSYSKLLATVNSKEKPEDVLVENTRKIEEIRVKREEMKRLYAEMQNEKKGKSKERKGSNSPQNRTPEDEGDIKLQALKGPFQIRITEPLTNPMYNAFSKIRERISNEDYVVDF